MYAGNEDLPPPQRTFIESLGQNIETIDVTAILDNKLLKLEEVGWATKPFAVLASTFEQILLLDADAIFLQRPEEVFDHHPGYLETGALLFHDRLLWQGAYKARHEWWETELRNFTPSATLAKSGVYIEGYAEEGDSGGVAIHTGKLDQVMGLLHICWQNSPGLRKISYSVCHGDKKTWWFGSELSGAPYAFEEHNGAAIGHTYELEGKKKVCGFTIAHLDAEDAPLWYNGGLLKNKVTSHDEFDVPATWMVNDTWEKDATRRDLSCMAGGAVKNVAAKEREIVQRSVDLARRTDKQLKKLP